MNFIITKYPYASAFVVGTLATALGMLAAWSFCYLIIKL